MSRSGNSHRFIELVRVVLVRLNMKRLINPALFLGGAILLTQGLYMDAKAIVAQGLIAHSWQQRAAASPPPKPWWWADTKAIAKLEVKRLNKALYVMQDDSGQSLAFGPGHLNASANISQDGHVMIAGHRDSHFEFIQNLETGDIIETTNHQSKAVRYRVIDSLILDTSSQDLILQEENLLSLITCYPFDGFVPGGPLRYIVNAQKIEL